MQTLNVNIFNDCTNHAENVRSTDKINLQIIFSSFKVSKYDFSNQCFSLKSLKLLLVLGLEI